MAMDLVDLVINRMDVDAELKHPIHALVCFSDATTGKKLGILAAQFAISRKEKSSITFLQLEAKEEEAVMENEVYQNRSFTSILEKGEKGRITVRTFVKYSEDWVSTILKISKEQECNLVLLGIDHHRFSPGLWQKYYRLKSNPAHSESYVFSHLPPNEAPVLNDIISLIDRNPEATGLFMNRGLEKTCKIFVPILSASDVQILPYVLFRFAQKEGVELMIWDAIGIIQSDQRVQKFYQLIVKKTDGRVITWDDDRKIERDFIQQQDLVIMGIDGWGKLLTTALPWIDALPSILIIKDNIL